MKRIIPLVIVMVMLLALAGCGHSGRGAAREDREELLGGHVVPERNWNIVNETEVGGYLVSAYASNDKSGLAVFAANKNGGYEFEHATTANTNDIIVTNDFWNATHYDLIWFNGAQTEYAEVIYTIDGKQQDALRFDTTDMDIIVNPSPAKEYSLQVIYYDAEGNTYAY